MLTEQEWETLFKLIDKVVDYDELSWKERLEMIWSESHNRGSFENLVELFCWWEHDDD